MTRASSRQRPPLLMVLLLVAGLLGVAVLTRISWLAHRRQETTATALLTGVADRVAARFATDLTSELYVGATALLNRARLGRLGAVTPGGRDPHRLLDAARDVRACRCAPLLTPAYAFRVDLRDGHVSTVSDSGGTPSPEVRSLQQVLAQRVGEGSWDFAIAPELDAGGRMVFFTRAPGNEQVLLGFAVDSATLRTELLQPMLDYTSKVFASMGLDSLAAEDLDLTIRLANGQPLSTSRAGGATGGPTADADLGSLFGNLGIHVALAPSATTKLLGAPLGHSPIPLLLLLSVAASVTMVVAFVAWRRSAELAASRADLVASMSHELRTPLAEILLVGESLQRGHYQSPDEHHQAVDVVVRESRRLLAMIGNVLQMATSGRAAPFHPGRVTLGDELRQVVADYQVLAATRNISVLLCVESDPVVHADTEAVRQILLNLLDNACRYGPPDATVRVTLERRGAWVRLAVCDEGGGIPETIRAKAWEPYVHTSTPYSQGHAGSGIGLAVVQALTTRHGGRTGAADDATGSTVYVELPLEG